MMTTEKLVICTRADDYAASLEPRKIYRVIDDVAAEKEQMVRIVDESGEDYLYPAAFFVSIELPESTRKALNLAA